MTLSEILKNNPHLANGLLKNLNAYANTFVQHRTRYGLPLDNEENIDMLQALIIVWVQEIEKITAHPDGTLCDPPCGYPEWHGA